MKNTTFVGNTGEQIAVDYLEKSGYKVIERNLKLCGCEVDIISEAYISDDGEVVSVKRKGLFGNVFGVKEKAQNEAPATRTLIFCEVKTRGGDSFGSGADAVTPYKIGRYITAAKAYTANKAYANVNVRFDVVEISDKGINHIKNVFTVNDAKYPRR